MAFIVRWTDENGPQEQRFADAVSALELVLTLEQPGAGPIETTEDDGRPVQLMDLTALATKQEERSGASGPKGENRRTKTSTGYVEGMNKL
jgi:hypothetical protein